ncbi:hypothetical protein Tco_0246826 [Tanacetum coccineum]
MEDHTSDWLRAVSISGLGQTMNVGNLAGLDVCVDLTGSSPLTKIRMADFALGRAMIYAAQRKCVKYEAKCATIGYGFLPFSFLP